MITLKQIHYALAVEQTRHFKKAADRCNVSQSTLSSAIAEMESQLGIPLFERDNKKVLVTLLGQQILDRVRGISLQVEDVMQLARSTQEPLSQTLSLGVIPTIAPYLLPIVLPAIRSEYPHLNLTIVEETSTRLVEMVKLGELDTAILALPFDLDGLLGFEFWQEDFYVVCHRDMISPNKHSIDRLQLQDFKLLLLNEGHCLTDHVLSVCHMPRPQNEKGLSGTSLFTLVQMVAGKMGVTLVPEMALPSLAAGTPELTAMRLDEPGPHRKIAFIARANYVGVNNLQLLMHLFKQQLASSKVATSRK